MSRKTKSTIHIQNNELWGPRYNSSYKSWDPPTRNNKIRYPFSYDDSGTDWEDQRNGYQLETMLTRDVAGFLGIADIISQELYGTKVNIQPDRLLSLIQKPFEISSYETVRGPDGKIYKNQIRKNITLLDTFTKAQSTLQNLLKNINNSAQYIPILGEIADDISGIVANSNDKLDQLLPMTALINDIKAIANDAKNQQRLIQASNLSAAASVSSPTLPKIVGLSGKAKQQAQLAELQQWSSSGNATLGILSQNYNELLKNANDLKKAMDNPDLDEKEEKEASDHYQEAMKQAANIKAQIDTYVGMMNELQKDIATVKKGNISDKVWNGMVKNYSQLTPNITRDNTEAAKASNDLAARIQRLMDSLATLTGSSGVPMGSSFVSSASSPTTSVVSTPPAKAKPKAPPKLKGNLIVQLWNDFASGYDITEVQEGDEIGFEDLHEEPDELEDDLYQEMFTILTDAGNYKTGIRTMGKSWQDFKNKIKNQGYSIFFNPKGATMRRQKMSGKT